MARMVLPHDELGTGPAVVLLHAGVADRKMWTELLQPLADAGLRAVAMDLPGFGEAPAALVEQAPWADVLATMDALGIEGACLVGNSFGGAVALSVAAVAPERVAALVLVSAPAPELEPSAELQAAWEAEEAALERDDVEAAVDAVLEAWTLPGGPPEVRDRVAATQRQAFARQAAASAGAPRGARDPDRSRARGDRRTRDAGLPRRSASAGAYPSPRASGPRRGRGTPCAAGAARGLPDAAAGLPALLSARSVDVRTRGCRPQRRGGRQSCACVCVDAQVLARSASSTAAMAPSR
jgi:pimeloyl-ACP methyl ester carboxylesterase